jgi:hypothetical protein
MKTNRQRSAGRHATLEHRAFLALERMGHAYLAKLKPSKLPTREHNGYMRVAGYLCALTWRIMNDRHKNRQVQPAHGELRRALRLYMDRYLSKFLREHDPSIKATGYQRFAFLDGEQFDYLADSLATSLLRDWTPDYIEERVRRGHRGREVARPRGPSWNADDLAVLSLFAHLPAREAFARYNAGRAKPRGRSTLYRMLRKLPLVETGDGITTRHCAEGGAGRVVS